MSRASEPLRLALIVEGPTDEVVLTRCVEAILGADRDFVATRIQPQTSRAFEGFGPHGGGWRGVLRKCDEIGQRGGPRASGLLANYDLVLVHLDGDVAEDPDIACARPCPPARDTADGLRAHLSASLMPSRAEPEVVLVVPMKETEAWLLPIFAPPADEPPCGWECVDKPSMAFTRGRPRLVRWQDGTARKQRAKYDRIGDAIRDGWPKVRALGEAARFEAELRTALDAADRR